jgi:hypothetical protein
MEGLRPADARPPRGNYFRCRLTGNQPPGLTKKAATEAAA